MNYTFDSCYHWWNIMQWKRLLKTATNNIGLIGVLTFIRSPAKYPLLKKGGRFCEENLLRYQNLPYVNLLSQIGDLPSINGCEPSRSFEKCFFFSKSATKTKSFADKKIYILNKRRSIDISYYWTITAYSQLENRLYSPG